MNKIKSLFIGMWPMLAMGFAGYSIYQLVNNGMSYIWLGTLLTTLPIMLFIGRVMMLKDISRTTAHFPLLTILAVIGIVLSIYGFTKLEPQNIIGIFVATIGFITFLLYNFWYSSFGTREHSNLKKGNILKEFSALASDGTKVLSTSFNGNPTIFIFFRGNWCPLCMAQIKEIANKYRDLSKYGAKVVLIAPQPEKNTKALAKKFNVTFVFLTDVKNQAARSLGIALPNGLPMGMEMLGYDKETVLPTTIITDATGKIIYSDMTENYRIRPEPSEFIKVLQNNA